MTRVKFPAWGALAVVSAPPPAPPTRGASPCVNVCRMDPVTGWCEGCLRTLDEIATWTLLDLSEREAVLASLDERRRLRGEPPAPTG